MIRRLAVLVALLQSVTVPAHAGQPLPVDPLNSPVWEGLAALYFGDSPVIFDSRLSVVFPSIAENQREFPVAVDARAIPDVKRIILFADLNPIQLALDFRPQGALPFIATRIKLDQRTPVRAAVQLADGSWRVNGRWIDAAGGGCSAPPISRVKGDWAQHLGEVRGRAVSDRGVTRVRLAFRHPMDTGLVSNIAAYNIDRLSLTDANGRALGSMSINGSVAEDPGFAFLVPSAGITAISFDAGDSNGRDYRGSVQVISAATALAAR